MPKKFATERFSGRLKFRVDRDSCLSHDAVAYGNNLLSVSWVNFNGAINLVDPENYTLEPKITT